MKIHILKENLLRSLQQVGRVISTKTQLPVLQNVLLETEEKMVRITATNMETTISVLVGAKVENDGKMCVPAKVFTELVTSMTADAIDLEEKSGSLLVSSPNAQATLSTTPAAEYPHVETEDDGKGQEIDTSSWKNALSQVLFAAATDDGRPLLTGVKITTKDDDTEIAATDGYRLSVKTMSNLFTDSTNLIVPARALSEVLKIVSDLKTNEGIKMGHTSSGQLLFSVGEVTIVTRLIDGEYPNYAKIIPSKHTSSVRIDKQSLLSAVKSASIFARDNANIVRFHIEGTTLTVSANTPQVGDNTVHVDVVLDGDGGDIAFNSRFLIDFLNNINTEEVQLEMTGALNPGLFRIPGDDSYLHIIMPVRVQN